MSRTLLEHALSLASFSRIGITGTDTGVGKTVVSSAIIAGLRAAGRRVAAMKPVETGDSDDAVRLYQACGKTYPLDVIRPIALPEPLAPLVAARRAHAPVQIEVLDKAFESLKAASDVVVVEGAGGILVPITETENFASLFKRWELDVIVVAANRLGVINHTLLTVAAARAHGLVVRAVVLNNFADTGLGVAERTNQAVLKELLVNVPVIRFPYVQAPYTLAQLAEIAKGLTGGELNRSV